MIFLICFFIFGLSKCIPNPTSDSSINIMGKNAYIDLDLECSVYSDCFNCTLAQCHWHVGNNSCAQTYERHSKPLEMLTVWQAVAGTCKDPLGLCDHDPDMETYSFKSE